MGLRPPMGIKKCIARGSLIPHGLRAAFDGVLAEFYKFDECLGREAVAHLKSSWLSLSFG